MIARQVLQSMGLQRVGHNWATEQQWLTGLLGAQSPSMPCPALQERVLYHISLALEKKFKFKIQFWVQFLLNVYCFSTITVKKKKKKVSHTIVSQRSAVLDMYF